jgi:hypothetical protein
MDRTFWEACKYLARCWYAWAARKKNSIRMTSSRGFFKHSVVVQVLLIDRGFPTCYMFDSYLTLIEKTKKGSLILCGRLRVAETDCLPSVLFPPA